jgi:hypothetical protein
LAANVKVTAIAIACMHRRKILWPIFGFGKAHPLNSEMPESRPSFVESIGERDFLFAPSSDLIDPDLKHLETALQVHRTLAGSFLGAEFGLGQAVNHQHIAGPGQGGCGLMYGSMCQFSRCPVICSVVRLA